MLKVGLTGGIGAGKSTVARRLAEHGAVVVDADVLAREVVAPGSEGLAAVVAAFGEGVLASDGSLDRPALAAVAFADDASRTRLNAILHPRIGLRTTELTGAAPADAVVVHDVPLLVENRMGALYHLVVVVHAPAEVRVRRLVDERGMPAGDAWARVGVQADDDARRAAADVWLDNTGGPDDVLALVDEVWERRLVPFAANLRARRPAVRPAHVEVVAPDPTWAAQGARIVERVRAAAGAAAVRVDHVGSTAVPDLPAKDLLDVQLVVRGLAAADDLALAEAGFPAREGDWWDDAPDGARLAKRVHAACDPARAVNLLVRDVEAPAWVWTLRLRDWLRAHPAEASAYAQVEASSAGTAIPEYDSPTGPWVTGAVRRSQEWAAATGWRPGEP